MICFLFGHTPFLGLTSKWKIKNSGAMRLIVRTHACESCLRVYAEIKPFDELTARLVQSAPKEPA